MAITVATSTGVAVTSQTRWPASRCIWARARVPGHTLAAITSSKTSSPMVVSSATVCPAAKDSAVSRASCTLPMSSRPTTRNLACCQANRPMSRAVKKSRAYRPRARWKIDAPCITVLSTSKNAAACGSSGTCSAASTSAAAADAWPATTASGSGPEVACPGPPQPHHGAAA